MKNENSWGYSLPQNTNYKRRYRSRPRDSPAHPEWRLVITTIAAFVVVLHLIGGINR